MARVIGNFSLLGFVDGITATAIVVSSLIFGLLSFYHARKLKAQLLSIAGLVMIFIGCFWLGPTSDFIVLGITGHNMSPQIVYGWLSYMMIAPATTCGFYLGSELMIPAKKKIITIFYLILGIIFEILIWTMPLDVFIFNEIQEGDLIDSGLNRLSPAFWLIIFFMISVLVFLIIGFAIKAIQATGDLRKKFAFLSLGFTMFFICGTTDSLFLIGIFLAIWRIGMVTSPMWMYLGLKTK